MSKSIVAILFPILLVVTKSVSVQAQSEEMPLTALEKVIQNINNTNATGQILECILAEEDLDREQECTNSVLENAREELMR